MRSIFEDQRTDRLGSRFKSSVFVKEQTFQRTAGLYRKLPLTDIGLRRGNSGLGGSTGVADGGWPQGLITGFSARFWYMHAYSTFGYEAVPGDDGVLVVDGLYFCPQYLIFKREERGGSSSFGGQGLSKLNVCNFDPLAYVLFGQLHPQQYYQFLIGQSLCLANAASKAHLGAQAECEHKDVIIGQLKGELGELRQLEGDFYKLNQLINGLEGKYSLLLAEKDRSEKEQKVKGDIDKQAILDLRAEIDDLRVQLQKANLMIEELLRGNTNLKRQCDSRSSQIQNFRYQIREAENKNQRSNDENRASALNIKSLKEERKRIEEECDDLSNKLDNAVAKLKAAEKEVRGVESSNARLEKTLYQAEKDNNKLVIEVKEKNEEVKKAEQRLKGVSNSIADLSLSYKNLEGQTAKSKAQLERNTAVLEAEVAKGDELQEKIGGVEVSIRSQENELDLIISQEEKLRKQHFAALERNKNLNLDIDKVLALIADYEQVNRELLDQIDYFIEQDQQARSMLDRQEVMRQIIDSSIRKVSLTEEAIKHLKC